MSNLKIHADRELRLAGLFDKDADYDGMIADAVMQLISVFAAQGHSGFSARLTLEIFGKIAMFKTLTPITSSSEDWNEVEDGKMWQSLRSPSCFSTDGGRTYYDIDAGSDELGDHIIHAAEAER